MKKAIWTVGLLVAVGVGAVWVVRGVGSDSSASVRSGVGGTQPLVVASANFPENALLAEIYAGALKAKGIAVATRLNIGSRKVLLPAMEKGQITVLPEYSGALLTYLSRGKAGSSDTETQVADLQAALPGELTVLKSSPAQDQETITCTRQVVDRYSLVSLEDLAKVSKQLLLGGPPELPARGGFGLKGPKATNGIEFKAFRPVDVAGPLTVSALRAGKVDCANLFSTQSAIQANGFVSLTDPKGLAESDAVIPLVARSRLTAAARAALDSVSAALTTQDLKEMVERVEVEKADPGAIAKQFLAAQHLN